MTEAQPTPNAPPQAQDPGRDPFAGVRRHALPLAVLGWTLFYAINAGVQTALVGIEAARLPDGPAPWQIATWEWSSGLAFLLLVPFVGWAESRFPLIWARLGRHLAIHLGLSVVYSLLHVALMVAMREGVYAYQGMDYRFGPWMPELVYEYLKDGRSYVAALTLFHLARLLLRRSQGEVSIPEALSPAPAREPRLEPAEAVPSSSTKPTRPERFVVRKLGKDYLVAAADIDYGVAAGNYVNLRVSGKDYPLRSTIAGLEAALDPARFVRIHRSAIVNVDQIAHIEPIDSGDARVAMRDGTVLPCSRRYKSALMQGGV